MNITRQPFRGRSGLFWSRCGARPPDYSIFIPGFNMADFIRNSPWTATSGQSETIRGRPSWRQVSASTTLGAQATSNWVADTTGTLLCGTSQDDWMINTGGAILGFGANFEIIRATSNVEFEFHTAGGNTLTDNTQDNLDSVIGANFWGAGTTGHRYSARKTLGKDFERTTSDAVTVAAEASAIMALAYRPGVTVGTTGAFNFFYYWRFPQPDMAIERAVRDPFWFFDSPTEIHRLGLAPVASTGGGPMLTMLGVS